MVSFFPFIQSASASENLPSERLKLERNHIHTQALRYEDDSFSDSDFQDDLDFSMNIDARTGTDDTLGRIGTHPDLTLNFVTSHRKCDWDFDNNGVNDSLEQCYSNPLGNYAPDNQNVKFSSYSTYRVVAWIAVEGPNGNIVENNDIHTSIDIHRNQEPHDESSASSNNLLGPLIVGGMATLANPQSVALSMVTNIGQNLMSNSISLNHESDELKTELVSASDSRFDVDAIKVTYTPKAFKDIGGLNVAYGTGLSVGIEFDAANVGIYRVKTAFDVSINNQYKECDHACDVKFEEKEIKSGMNDLYDIIRYKNDGGNEEVACIVELYAEGHPDNNIDLTQDALNTKEIVQTKWKQSRLVRSVWY